MLSAKVIKNLLTVNYTWVLVLIVVFACWIRLYNLNEWMPFISDQGRDFLAAQQMVESKELPLLGIPSSVPRFKQGPVYVWFTGVGLIVGQGNPVVVGYMAVFLGVLAIVATVLLAHKHFGITAAIVSGIILSISPLAIIQSRLAFHTNPIPLVSALFLWLLFRWLDRPKFNLFWVGLCFAILFQFELVVAPLFGLILLVWWWHRSFTGKKQILLGLLGLVLGLLPQILYDFTHRFEQLGTFIVWIGYRIAGFFGVFTEHKTSTSKLTQVLITSFEYAQKFISWQLRLPTISWLISLPILIFLKKEIPRTVQLLLVWLGLMLVSFVVLGNASEAYFPVLFVPIALLTGVGVSWIKNKIAIGAVVFSLVMLGIINTNYLIKAHFLIADTQVAVSNPYYTYGPSVKEQLEVVKFIDDRFDTFSIESTDPNAQFSSYLDNYRYLLRWRASPETNGAALIIINHKPDSVAEGLKYQFGTVTVVIPISL